MSSVSFGAALAQTLCLLDLTTSFSTSAQFVHTVDYISHLGPSRGGLVREPRLRGHQAKKNSSAK
jgi:hypothetical protein